MTDYRAYILDAVGEILIGEDVEANSDMAAIAVGWEFAAQYSDSPQPHGLEVWQARRCVFSTHPRS
jgi:hypothetical protein